MGLANQTSPGYEAEVAAQTATEDASEQSSETLGSSGDSDSTFEGFPDSPTPGGSMNEDTEDSGSEVMSTKESEEDGSEDDEHK